jgi:23S rRNA pseudouridine2605 synthase
MSKPERLQKVLAHCGVASRRGAEEIIASGRVVVNGEVVTEQGVKVDLNVDEVRLDGKRVLMPKGPSRVLMLNKPKGYVSTVKDPHAEKTVMELIDSDDRRLYPVGRLDKDSRGLMLMTDDGELAHRLLHPSHEATKVYLVRARGDVDQKDIEKLATGIMLEDGKTAPASLQDVSIQKDMIRFRITIKEGKKRQIRLMVRAIGAHVFDLRRVEFAGLGLGDLPEGKWRELSAPEIAKLRKQFGLSGRKKN